MKKRIKDAGLALFFLIIVALVAVEAAESARDQDAEISASTQGPR